LDFDGVDDFVTISDSPSLNVDYATISMWVKLDTIGNSGSAGLIAKGDNFNRQYWLWTYGESIHWSIDGVIAKSTMALTTGRWYHVALTYDGSSSSLYLDGSLDTTFPQTSGTILSDNDPLLIGKLPGLKHIDGQIDDVRIYNRALTPSEVAVLANP
jgi:hypothetical protein